MIPIGYLSSEYEKRHASMGRKRIEKALKIVRGVCTNSCSEKFGNYVNFLTQYDTEWYLTAHVDQLRGFVREADTLLPKGDFWIPNSNSYEEEFAEFHKKINELIDYEGFVRMTGRKKNKPWGGDFLSMLLSEKVKYCPYCNAETVQAFRFKKGSKPLDVYRAAFDHYFPRARYPMLGISLYNLIPACTRCNSSFKHDETMGLADMAHPYIDDVHAGMKFVPTFNSLRAFTYCREEDVEYVEFKERNPDTCKSGVLWNNVFMLNTVYTQLYKRETADAQCNAIRYPQSYIDMKTDELRKAGFTQSEIERLHYRAPLDPNEIDKNRFAKLIIDIVSTYRK